MRRTGGLALALVLLTGNVLAEEAQPPPSQPSQPPQVAPSTSSNPSASAPSTAPPSTSSTPPASAPGAPPTSASEPAVPTVDSPTTRAWTAAYEDARAKLLAGEFSEAAAMFAELERNATNRSDRTLAHEQWVLSDEWSRRRLALVRKSDVPEIKSGGVATDHRSTDEIVSLYASSVVYGLGTGTMLDIDLKANSATAVTLPLLLGTGASVGTVVGLDWGRGFRYGVPQSIVSGMYLGLEDGIFWALLATTAPNTSWDAVGAGTFIWATTTAGAVAGGVIGQSWGTSPGRAAFVGSSGLWVGMVGTFGSLAFLSSDDARLGTGVGGAGVLGGAILGGVFASSVSPSVWRMRLVDIGGVVGGLLGAGTYAIVAPSGGGDGRLAAGLITLGMASGVGTSFWLTSGMEHDYPAERTSEDTKRSAWLSTVTPVITPSPRGSGATLGLAGTL